MTLSRTMHHAHEPMSLPRQRRHLAFPCLLVWLVVVASCTPKVTSEPQSKPVAAPTFDWPKGLTCNVTHEVAHKMGSYSLRFGFDTEHRPDGSVRVRFRDYALRLPGGAPLAASDAAQLADVAHIVILALPDFSVTKDGMTVTVEALESYPARVRATLGSNQSSEAALATRFGEPQVRDSVIRRVTDVWNVWVGSWLKFKANQPARQKAIPIADGISLDYEITETGRWSGSSLRLEKAQLADGPKSLEAMRKMVARQGVPSEALSSFRKELRLFVEMNPDSAVPTTAGITNTTNLVMGGASQKYVRGDKFVFNCSQAAR